MSDSHFSTFAILDPPGFEPGTSAFFNIVYNPYFIKNVSFWDETLFLYKEKGFHAKAARYRCATGPIKIANIF